MAEHTCIVLYLILTLRIYSNQREKIWIATLACESCWFQATALSHSTKTWWLINAGLKLFLNQYLHHSLIFDGLRCMLWSLVSCRTCKSGNADDTLTFTFICDVAVAKAAYVALFILWLSEEFLLGIGQEVSQLIICLVPSVRQRTWGPGFNHVCHFSTVWKLLQNLQWISPYIIESPHLRFWSPV